MTGHAATAGLPKWTGLAPWEFEFPFPGSLTSISRVSDGPPRDRWAPEIDKSDALFSLQASDIAALPPNVNLLTFRALPPNVQGELVLLDVQNAALVVRR